MSLTKSEAGRLGGLASKKANQIQYQNRVRQYNENPSYCNQCNIHLSYDKRHNKFCSKSCSITFNNLKKESKFNNKCLSCNTIIEDCRDRVYCNHTCQINKQRTDMYQTWFGGEIPSKQTRTLRNLLIEFEGNECSVCHITSWNDQILTMELDHIDGNPYNHAYNNVRLICPNCHAQTPTYKGKNIGNGRSYRRQRYAENKSY